MNISTKKLPSIVNHSSYVFWIDHHSTFYQYACEYQWLLGLSPSLRSRFTLWNGYNCFLRKFLAIPTSLIPVIFSGSFHWIWLQFIYIRSKSGGLNGRSHLCQKISFAKGVLSTEVNQA